MLKHWRKEAAVSRGITAAHQRDPGSVEQLRIVGQFTQYRAEGFRTLRELVGHVVAKTEHLAEVGILGRLAKQALDSANRVLVAFRTESDQGPILLQLFDPGIPPSAFSHSLLSVAVAVC